MSEKKSPMLPRLELMIIAIFFLSFAAWVLNKCSDRRSQYLETQAEEAVQAMEDSLLTQGLNATSLTSSENTSNTEPATISPQAQDAVDFNTIKTTLYVIIDGLNMRDQPNLKGEVLERLSLFEEVQFLNEVTDSTTQLKLSEDITADEPWVKVMNRKGKSGWVFGAGVHYHRKKYPGLD